MVSYFTKRMSWLYQWLVSSPITMLLALLPVALFFVYFFALRYNIPWFDDYENIPYFLDNFLKAPSFSGKMAALFRPNNEHRVVYARLVSLGQYFLTGGLNFANLMLWGNASLVLMFYLLYRALQRHEGGFSKKALVGAFPVPFILFSAQMYLMTFTAVFSLQYLSIIMLIMLTCFVLATNRPINLALAIALAILSSFSMGNGLLVWPAGAGILLIQRRWTALSIWVLMTPIIGYLYFLGYPVQQGNAEGFAYVMAHPLQTIAGFFILAGSAFDLFPTLPVEHRVYLPFLAGLTLVIGVGYWSLQILFRAKKNTSFFESFVFGCLLFLVASVALLAFFRIRFYFGMMVHLPYRIYSLTLWSLASVLLFSRLSETARMRIWPAICGTFIALNIVTSATYLPGAIERRKHMQGLTFNQVYNDTGLGGIRNSELASFIANLLAVMKDRDWYHLPDPIITPDDKQLLAPVSKTVSTVSLQVNQQSDYLIVSSNVPDYEVGYNKGDYVILKSDTHTYLMFAERKRPLGFWPWKIEPGFSTAIPIAMVLPGRYQLGLFHTYPDHTDHQFIDKFVNIP